MSWQFSSLSKQIGPWFERGLSWFVVRCFLADALLRPRALDAPVFEGSIPKYPTGDFLQDLLHIAQAGGL
jgi:hypothetical protein